MNIKLNTDVEINSQINYPKNYNTEDTSGNFKNDIVQTGKNTLNKVDRRKIKSLYDS